MLNAPVEHVVVLEAFTDKQVPEQFAQIGIVRLVVEAKSTAVVEEDAKLVGEAAAQQVGGGRHLLLHDSVILLLLGSSLEALPWQSTTEEVHENVGERLEIVTTSLLCNAVRNGVFTQVEKLRTNSQVGVDGGITGSSSQVLVLAVWNVEVGLGVTVLLGETEIDNVDLISTLANAHQEIVGLDVTMDKVAGVNVLHSGNLERNRLVMRCMERSAQGLTN